MTSLTERIALHDGNAMPLFGLGCWEMDDNTTYNAVTAALKTGYRLFDTAAFYHNEEAIGKALKDSGLRREEFFVVTKLNSFKHGYNETVESLETSLKKLDLDYVDLYLIHTPLPGRVIESWKAIIESKNKGKIKSIGVSNFGNDHIQALLDEGLEKPTVNQIELHPLNRQTEAVQFCRKNNIAVMGYCPLARGELFGDGKYPLFDELSITYKRTKAQIFLRWAVQSRYITIPKSANAGRIKENSELYDFELREEDMTRIEQLDGVVISAVSCPAMYEPWEKIKDYDRPGKYMVNKD